MSPRAFLGLVALGPVDPEILRRLRIPLTKFFGLPVKILKPLPLPEETRHIVRQQYHSTQLLEYLLKTDTGGALRVLGVTAVDLYIPILTFVFGEAQLDGQAAVISLFRPRGDADGTNPPLATVLGRLLKLGIHELGHTFGLGHCREEGCLMKFSPNLSKLDEKNLTLCRYCQVLLADFFLERHIIPQLKKYEGTLPPAVATPIRESVRKRRR
jgi:archaemetzincin